jgi:hypothetical protein
MYIKKHKLNYIVIENHDCLNMAKFDRGRGVRGEGRGNTNDFNAVTELFGFTH